MSWDTQVETVSTTTHTAKIQLEATSSSSASDAESSLVRVLRRAADDIEHSVDRRKSVMAP